MSAESQDPVSSASLPIADRIAALGPGLARLHASPWAGLVEEVGTGSWVQALLQSEPGASATLIAGRSSYARSVQEALYGAQGRSVSAAATAAWAEALLQSAPGREHFALALSGAVASHLQSGDDHAWLALALSDGRRWSLHARCREPGRLAQQLSLGELGIHLLTRLAEGGPEPDALPQGLIGEALEIDVWSRQGLAQGDQDAEHESELNECLDAVALVASGASPLVLLMPEQGRMRQRRYLDLLRGRRLLLHKGSFNPVTRAHLAMPAAVLAQDPGLLPVLELSLQNADKGGAERLNLAQRLMMLARASAWPVALTRTPALYETRELFSGRGQAAGVDFVCGEDLYRRLWLEKYYAQLPGGIAEGLERLFAGGTRLWVCGRATELDFPPEARARAESYAGALQRVPLDLPFASSDVRAAIAAGQAGWQAQLAPAVADYIAARALYK